MKHTIHIFTDGSVNTKLKVGYGAYLILPSLNGSKEGFANKVEIKKFEQTSSTKLELQILLHALSEVNNSYRKEDLSIVIYTDSQNIVSLPDRKTNLEKKGYFSSKGKKLNNHELYQEFFDSVSNLNPKIIKISGHQPSKNKNEIDKIFSLVDKASRRALRKSN